MFVLLYSDQDERDAVISRLKVKAKGENVSIRVISALTKLEATNKNLLYYNLKTVEGLQLVDWGNKVMVVVHHKNDKEFREVVQLNVTTPIIVKYISQYVEQVQMGDAQ